MLVVVFNRPDSTAKVVEALARVRPAEIYVASDGPRPGKIDEAACQATREIFENLPWECRVHRRFNDENLGCRLGVSSAISWFFDQVPQGIILEDDCLPDPSFFGFCDELLDRYADDDRIMQISGTSALDYQVDDGGKSYFFTRHHDIWGWATWRRAWKTFDMEMDGYPEFRREKRMHDYLPDRLMAAWLTAYLDAAFHAKSNVWSSQWSYSIARNNGLSISPWVDLVVNFGFAEEQATNATQKSWKRYGHLSLEPVSMPLAHPKDVLPHGDAERARLALIRKTDPWFSWRAFGRRKLSRLLGRS